MISSQFISQYRASFTQNWLKFLILGIVLVILGGVAISASALTTFISVIFLGSLILMGGIVLVMDAFIFGWKKWSWFFLVLFSGLLYTLLGIMFISNPMLVSASLTLFLGFFYLVIGFFRTIYILFTRVPNWGWGLLSGLVSLLLGALILSNWPESGLYIIGLFVGIDLLLVGWAYIMIALAARSGSK